MTKKDSKTGYSIVINYHCANCLRVYLGHEPLTSGEWKGLAELVKEISLVKHEDDFDYLE